MQVYVVTCEMRDFLGRIVEEIDSIYGRHSNAVARRKAINSDPAQYPGMVADTTTYQLLDGAAPLDVPPKGSRSQGLDPQKVTEIRARAACGETCRQLAAEYGVSRSTISDVVTRKSWSWVS